MLYAIDFEDKETKEINSITMIANSKREAWDKTRNLSRNECGYGLDELKKKLKENGCKGIVVYIANKLTKRLRVSFGDYKEKVEAKRRRK